MSFPHVDLRKARHAVVLAECQSYVAAARELHLTQPALSRSIQALEQTFGVRLFDRNRSGVEPTAIGAAFVSRAKALLQEAGDLDALMTGASGGKSGEVAVGLGPLPATAFLGPVLKRVADERPKIKLSVSIQGAASLLVALHARALDVAVCAERLVAEDSALIVEPIGALETAMLVRAGHPLADEGCVDEDQILTFPLASGALGERPPHSSEPSFLRRLRPSILCDDFSALKRLTLATDVIWWAAPLAAREELEKGEMVVLQLANTMPLQRLNLVAVRLRGRTLSPAAEFVFSALETAIAEAGAASA